MLCLKHSAVLKVKRVESTLQQYLVCRFPHAFTTAATVSVLTMLADLILTLFNSLSSLFVLVSTRVLVSLLFLDHTKTAPTKASLAYSTA